MSQSYDRNKAYKWTPNDEFLLSGAEFGTILNAFRAVLSTPEAQKIIMVERANEAIESVLARAVESGQVVESIEENPSSL
jgi:hypothetical protein